MNEVILDASFVLKWVLLDEDGVEEARQVHDKIINGELRAYIPEILKTEILNVLFWKQKFTKQKILEFLDMMGDGKILVVSMDKFEYKELLEAMDEYKITVFDAYYVILAKRNKCKLMSFDKKMSSIAG